jgi:hypothetical protein
MSPIPNQGIMITKIAVLSIILALYFSAGFAQEKTKKQTKAERKVEKQKQVEAMMDARTFVFTARTAIPQGYKTVNLNTNMYNVSFAPENIISYLPYYGRAYSGIGYGNDSGLKFEGKPEEFTITKGKKNFTAKAVVKGERDLFTLMLTVSFEGSASLSVSSNNRSTISYNGVISEPEKPAEP